MILISCNFRGNIVFSFNGESYMENTHKLSAKKMASRTCPIFSDERVVIREPILLFDTVFIHPPTFALLPTH